ncbi:hypothetical protein COO60DRAFT_1478500 [Scenedesmus sp. NREL 46B-D3]|nr:hypothetical protein COO60DRAFT_1478500 [Scenedesmus sp. NREL 46B-D3]
MCCGNLFLRCPISPHCHAWRLLVVVCVCTASVALSDCAVVAGVMRPGGCHTFRARPAQNAVLRDSQMDYLPACAHRQSPAVEAEHTHAGVPVQAGVASLLILEHGR